MNNYDDLLEIKGFERTLEILKRFKEKKSLYQYEYRGENSIHIWEINYDKNKHFYRKNLDIRIERNENDEFVDIVVSCEGSPVFLSEIEIEEEVGKLINTTQNTDKKQSDKLVLEKELEKIFDNFEIEENKLKKELEDIHEKYEKLKIEMKRKMKLIGS